VPSLVSRPFWIGLTSMADPQTESALLIYVLGDKSLAELVPAEVNGQRVDTACLDGGQLLPRNMPDNVPDVVLMDVQYAIGEDSPIERILRHYRTLPVPVIVVGEDASVDTVVRCIKKGAEDYLPLKDAKSKLPHKLVEHARNHMLLAQVKRLSDVYEKGGRLCDMVGVSPAMQDTYATIKSIADTDATVFVSGESGTGKELVARAIHTLSSRSDGHFVPVNCAAIPKDLLESELFGHEKGSFTSADKLHIGSCERADAGTLFLDEICEMNLGLQSKLLRFLQDYTFTRVGGNESILVNTRVIAATNKDPLSEVENGALRDDLYYRLNVVPIHVPPLRERPEDIAVLAEHYLKVMCDKYLKYFVGFSPEAVRVMLSYPWPGNVRELRNTLERIVVLATEEKITPKLFPERIRKVAQKANVPPLAVEEALERIQNALQSTATEQETDEVLPFVEVEKRAILSAIKKCSGDISKAARKLGLSRATLYRKLDKYGAR
jgi:two-component system repressor protein LuxO